MPLIIFCTIILILLCYRLFKNQMYWYDRNVKQNCPVPIFGDHFKPYFRLESFFESIWKNYQNFYNERYYGMYQMMTPTLVVKDLALIEKIVVTDFEHFTDRFHVVSESNESVWSKNLCILKGEQWKYLRATMIPAFTNCKIKSMFKLVNECAEQFSKHYYLYDSDEILIETKDAFTRYANDVIATCAFGVRCDSLKERNNLFYLMGKEASDLSSLFTNLKIGLNVFFPKMCKFFNIHFNSERAGRFFKSVVKETTKIREEKHIVRPDMLHILNQAKKSCAHWEGPVKDRENCYSRKTKVNLRCFKESLTDDDVTGQLLAFVSGGFDIVSNALTFLAYELALNPDIQEKLRAEIDRTWCECSGIISYNDLVDMKYLDMVICETLRKWPTRLILERVCVKPYVIPPKKPGESEIRLDVGSVVWIPTLGIHRDPEFYPEPERFDPERFNDANKQNIKEFSYLSFGKGPRSCIGVIFALLEMKILCFHLLKKFEIVPVQNTNIPIKLSKRTFNTLANGYNWLGLKKRRCNLLTL